MIPAFRRARTVNALDRAVIVIDPFPPQRQNAPEESVSLSRTTHDTNYLRDIAASFALLNTTQYCYFHCHNICRADQHESHDHYFSSTVRLLPRIKIALKKEPNGN
jgi:hypothetical protein